MRNILSNEFDEVVLNNEKVVLVDMYANWCGPCKMLAPILEMVEMDTKEWLDIVKIDVDECEDIARKLGVMVIPTLFVYKNGKQLESFSGFKTSKELKEILEKYR